MPTKCSCCSLAFTGSTTCKDCSSPTCSTCRNEGTYGKCCSCAGDSCARGGGGGEGGGGGGGYREIPQWKKDKNDAEDAMSEFLSELNDDLDIALRAEIEVEEVMFDIGSEARHQFMQPRDQTMIGQLQRLLQAEPFKEFVEDKDLKIITISNCDAYDRNDPDVEWKESCYELVVTANWAADPRPSDEVLTKLLKQAFEMDD